MRPSAFALHRANAPPRALFFATLLVCAAGARADVTLEQTTRIEGAGLMRMMNMSTRTSTSIAGQRSRTDTDLKMDSRVMRMFAGGPRAEIALFDRDTLYQLDLKKKKYTETTFAAERAKIEQVMAQMRQAQTSQRQSTSGVDESQCEWSAPSANVSRPADKTTLAGFAAEHVVVTAAQSCANRSNRAQVCEFRLTVDQWLTPSYPGGQEVLDYYRTYAEKFGLAVSGSPDFAQRAESLFGSYPGIWREVVARTKQLKGHPLKSSMSLAVGGPRCSRDNDPAQPQPQTPAPTQTVGGAVGGAIGGAIGGLFGKKKQQTPAAGPTTAPPPGGLVPILTISSEILSVSSAAANAQLFEVPSNFKKSG